MWILFIFGTFNCDDTPLIRDIYPYIIFLWLNILEKKAMLFLQEKQKSLMEKDFKIISFKRPYGKQQTLKLSTELEKSDVLKSLDQAYRKASANIQQPKLKQKNSLPLEKLKFGDALQDKNVPSKSYDGAQIKSIKKYMYLTPI